MGAFITLAVQTHGLQHSEQNTESMRRVQSAICEAHDAHSHRCVRLGARMTLDRTRAACDEFDVQGHVLCSRTELQGSAGSEGSAWGAAYEAVLRWSRWGSGSCGLQKPGARLPALGFADPILEGLANSPAPPPAQPLSPHGGTCGLATPATLTTGAHT